MKYRCKLSVDPNNGEFDSSFFTEGIVYEFEHLEFDEIQTIDDLGGEHGWTISSGIFKKHFTLIGDIIVNTVSFPIEEILIPTKRDGFCNYRLDNTTETIVEIWEDRKNLTECDRIGFFKEDIPLLVKGLEKIYDEYMDAKEKNG